MVTPLLWVNEGHSVLSVLLQLCHILTIPLLIACPVIWGAAAWPVCPFLVWSWGPMLFSWLDDELKNVEQLVHYLRTSINLVHTTVGVLTEKTWKTSKKWKKTKKNDHRSNSASYIWDLDKTELYPIWHLTQKNIKNIQLLVMKFVIEPWLSWLKLEH